MNSNALMILLYSAVNDAKKATSLLTKNTLNEKEKD